MSMALDHLYYDLQKHRMELNREINGRMCIGCENLIGDSICPGLVSDECLRKDEQKAIRDTILSLDKFGVEMYIRLGKGRKTNERICPRVAGES